MHMRTHSATSSRQSSSGVSSSGPSATSRRYRRVAHSPQVDDTLFGESHASKTRKNDRTLQAAREIMGLHSANQEDSSQNQNAGKSSDKRKQMPGGGHRRPAVVVQDNEVERIKNETKIFTPSELEAREAARDAELERQRMSSKARKEHMMRLSEEAARRAPKSEIEQILEAENKEILRRAAILKDQTHDLVKHMKTLGGRAREFTVRDQQLKLKVELEDEEHMYDEKMNILMEVERLEGLKRQEEVDEIKKNKRIADRLVLEEQIAERRRQREIANGLVAQEGREMIAKMQQQSQEEAEKERIKHEQAKKSMAEVQRFNDENRQRKVELQRKTKDEDEQIAAYQRKKAEDLKRLEEEEERKRYEAELRCAKLRTMQEKMANEKAELDELRAKRAAEGRERQAREADLALARKNKQEMDELRRAREAQALHRQRARVKEATLQQSEYESIMNQVEAEKLRVKEDAERKKHASMEHRSALQQHIEENEKLKKNAFARKQAEGQALKEEFARELSTLERIRLEEVAQLEKSGVNPLYLSEMKALDIERIRNR